MKKLLKVECKRAFCNKTFYACLGIGAVLSIWLLCIQVQEVKTFEQMILEYGIEKVGLYYPRSIYNSFIGLDYAYLPSTILYTIFPILVTLPHGISYYYDKKIGYMKNILIKSKRRDYFLAKYVSVFMSGFVMTMLILLFSFWLSALFFPGLLPEVTTAMYCPFDKHALLIKLFYSHPWLYVLIYIFIDAVFFGVIATVAIAISCYSNHMLLVCSGGMMIYLMVDLVTELLGKPEFSPLKFLRPTQMLCNANPVIIIVELAVLISLVMILLFKVERKKDVF